MKILKSAEVTLKALFGRHKTRYSVVECSEDMANEARIMHAEAFLKAGFITDDDRDDRGIIKPSIDKYHDIAEYFIAEDRCTRKPNAACRLLASDSIDHLQAIKSTEFTEDESDFLRAIEPPTIVELSGLAKKKGASPLSVLALFRGMLILSRYRGTKYWIMVINEGYYNHLKNAFPDYISEIGKPSEYMNTKVISCIIDLDKIFTYKPPIYKPLKKFKHFINSYVYLS